MEIQNKRKYFIFMDESGNNIQDRFFVLGILMIPVEEVGQFFDFLENISFKIKTRSQKKMHDRINKDYENNNIKMLLQYAKSTKSFEIKFKSINHENKDLYIHILHKYFKQINYRFSAIVIDRQNMFNKDSLSHWNRYLNNAAMLIVDNIKNIINGEFTIIADQITQPKNELSYENYLCNIIREKLQIKEITYESIFGSIRIESHSANFLQLVDIFVGAISYDFIGKDKDRKLDFMKEFRKYLNVNDKIQHDLIRNKPNYFSVMKYNNSF